MAYITEDMLDTLNEIQADVRRAYGECIIDDDKIKYTSEPADDLTNAERRQSLENLLEHIAAILDEVDNYEE